MRIRVIAALATLGGIGGFAAVFLGQGMSRGRNAGEKRFLAFRIGTLPIATLLSACVAFHVAGEVQKGRMELKYGNHKDALSHFQRAAEMNPDYLLNFSLLEQGIWTYVGRSYYDAGNFSEAREALKRARLRYDHDHLAKLYLGLAMARNGDQLAGLKEIEAGLKGLGHWLDYIAQYRADGRYWDPGRKIRSEIQRQLDLIEGRDFTWQELITSGEWLGREVENEIDEARREKIRDRQRRREMREGFFKW